MHTQKKLYNSACYSSPAKWMKKLPLVMQHPQGPGAFPGSTGAKLPLAPAYFKSWLLVCFVGNVCHTSKSNILMILRIHWLWHLNTFSIITFPTWKLKRLCGSGIKREIKCLVNVVIPRMWCYVCTALLKPKQWTEHGWWLYFSSKVEWCDLQMSSVNVMEKENVWITFHSMKFFDIKLTIKIRKMKGEGEGKHWTAFNFIGLYDYRGVKKEYAMLHLE